MGRNKSRKPEVPLKSKLKKDPGVPKLPSLRLRNAEKQKLHHHTVPHRPDPDSTMASEPTLSSLAELAAAASSSVPSTSTEDQQTEKFRTKEQLRKHYIRTLHKVIDESDIIVLVLDARDPEGCRSRLVEEEVRRREAEGKRLVFVLNKIDLVPSSNAQAWLRYLRHSTPTLPFRSVTSSASSTISTSTSPALIRLLKAYRPSGKQSITVGVVGYPNVGKSSLVNALKRVKVCPVAAQPGHTTSLQTIHLERGIRIVDSPGVIFEDDNDENGKESKARGSLTLRNVMKVENVDDPIEVVEEILSRVDPAIMQKLYNLPPFAEGTTGFGSTLEFLTMLALTSGRLLKGGTPDILGTARQVVNDWNHQKIPYFTVPPTVHPSSVPSTVPSQGGVVAPGAENVGQARIISEYGKAFEVEGLFGMADQGAFGKGGEDRMAVEEEEGKDVFMDEAANMMVTDSGAPKSLKRSRSPSPSPAAGVGSSSLAPNRAPSPSLGRPPKRLRRMHASEPIPPSALANMASSNPLNRRAQKREAKRARKAGKVRPTTTHGRHARMEVDDDHGPGGIGLGLGGTFFTGLDFGGVSGAPAGMEVA